MELVEVDLRWGISEEQATRRETLKLCLDEIRACRPFFVGLLGERYGWVPGDEAFTPDLDEEQPWLKELHDRSVTELEILHGVLNDPEMAGRAFFYFRDPAYAAGRGPDYQAESPEAAVRQTALKERIRTVCREEGIPLREGYADPRALAETVRADLQAAVDVQYPAESIPDPLERVAREHEAFAEFRRRVYIGRPEYNEALGRHALAKGGPLVVVGESGSGKSALLANWLRDWREAHPGDLIFQHYTGGTPSSANHWRLLSRLLAEIKRWTGDEADLPVSHEEILRDLAAWLAKLRAKAERDGVLAVVVLDALNQIEETDGARRLGWLPGGPFAGALRLIVSSLPGEALEAVERRGWPALRVEPLTSGERRQMIIAYLARFGKQLDGPRLERLAAVPAAANPLYLKLLLDELRVTGTHDRLDERLDGYLTATEVEALLDQILARNEQAYERDRPGLVGEALALVWAARRGLSEPELLVLMRPEGLPQLPAAIWAPLRAALDESLVDRGGILGFAHEFLRAAVERRYAAGEEQQRALRMRLAAYFEGEGATARTCDELPWLFWQAGERDRLRACLLEMERFDLVLRRDQQELLGYWLWLGEVEAMGARYEAAFEAWERGTGSGADPERAGIVANELAFFLRHSGRNRSAGSLYRRALAIRRQALGERHPDTATAYNNLGMLLKSAGDLAGARPYYEQALAIRRDVLGESHPNTAQSLNNLGTLLQAMNDLPGARALLERALAIRQKVLGERHPNTASSLNNLGSLLEAMGDLAGARPFYERALAIWQEVLGARHPNTAISLNNLGLLLQAVGDRAGARSYLEQALAIWEEVLGERHPQTALGLNNLGLLFQKVGDLTAAQRCFERALAIRQEVLGERHPHTAASLNNLGMLLKDTGDRARARSYLERAVAILEARLGPDHPQAQGVRRNLERL